MVVLKRVGILALQGSVIEHKNSLSSLENIEPVEVKTLEELKSVDALIIPGGESTTIGKLLRDFGLMEPIRARIISGMPVWGTCAGMIILAKEIEENEACHLGLMDIRVRRNAYGSQLDSFCAELEMSDIFEHPFPAVFIRAPWVEEIGTDVKVISRYNDKIVAVRQNNMLATSFHPELTQDSSFHKYFTDMA